MLQRYNESNLEQSNSHLLVTIFETWRQSILSSHGDFLNNLCSAIKSFTKLQHTWIGLLRKIWLKNQHISGANCSIKRALDHLTRTIRSTLHNSECQLSVGEGGLFPITSIQRVNICLFLPWIKTSVCSQGAARDGLPVADTLAHENLNWTCIYLKLVWENTHCFVYSKQPILLGENPSDLKDKLCHFCTDKNHI